MSDQPGTDWLPRYDHRIHRNYGAVPLQGHNPTIVATEEDAREKVLVKLVSIDSLNLQAVDLMKIDAEGMEEQVLRGAEAMVGRFRPLIIRPIFMEIRRTSTTARASRM